MEELNSPQLTPEHFKQLNDAKAALKKIRRAVSVARFDGWSIAVFAALSLVCGFSSVWGLAIGTIMAVIAYVELRNADRLSKLDLAAIRTLALNQLAFASLLVVYAVWTLCTFNVNTGLASNDLAQLGMSESQIKGWARLAYFLVYGCLIMVAVFGQGGLALYYLGRKKLLEKYLNETPEWIVAMQRQGIAN